MQIKKIITEVIIGIFILLWAFAFVSKILDFDTFERQLNGSYLTSVAGKFLAYALEILHAVIVVLLLNNRSRKIGMISSMALISIYTGYIIYVLNFAPTVPCSCISLFSWMNWNAQLKFNILFLVLNAIGVVLMVRNNKIYQLQNT